MLMHYLFVSLQIVEIDGQKYFDNILRSLILRHRHEEIISILDNVTNLNDTADWLNITLLHFSVICENVTLTKYLIERGCTIDPLDKNRETPLITAIKSRRKYQVRLLLAANADFNAIDAKGKTALSMLFELRHGDKELEIFNVLVDKLIVIYGNDEELLARRLIDIGCPLDKVVYFKNPNLMARMLEKGCKVNKNHRNRLNNTALHVAAMWNYLEIVKVLLQFGADVTIANESGYIPLSIYINRHSEQDLGMIEALMPCSFDWLNRKVKDFHRDRFSFFYIFTKGTKETLGLFQSRYNIDFSDTDQYGETPLHYLMINKNDGILEPFADTKLDVNARDRHFRTTALQLAATSGNLDSVKFLLDKGAQVNQADLFGLTPLWLAGKNIVERKDNGEDSSGMINSAKCMELLMLHGADAEVETFFDAETVLGLVKQAKVFELMKSVLANLALLDISGKLKNKEIRKEIYGDDDSRGYYEICKQQLKETKMLCLCGTVTVYTILTEDDENIALYTRRHHIDDLVTKKFPLESYYTKLLHKRLLDAAKVNDLRSKVARLLADIIGLSDPCHLIIDKIVYMLKISDLQEFIS